MPNGLVLSRQQLRTSQPACGCIIAPGGVLTLACPLGQTRITPPSVVKYCALFPNEITSFSLLDPMYHQPERLIAISPFLFTVVIALASRHYKKRGLHGIAMEFARDAAGKALVDSPKTIETCQAFLLLAEHPIPLKRWSKDRSWVFIGVAFGLGKEIGLHLPPVDSLPEREQLNRTRVWLNCFCADASYSVQSAKLPMIPRDDYVARTSRDWYKSSPSNIAWDIHLCWYVHMLTVMLEYLEEVSTWRRKEEDVDIVATAVCYDQQFYEICETWEDRFAEHIESHGPVFQYRTDACKMIAAYMRLVVLSHGFQHGPRSAVTRDSHISRQSIACARTAIEVIINCLFPSGRIRFALDVSPVHAPERSG
ncbi:hypothetical protein BS17DRAFT_716196 [Gyrodon lividus]|nr:hypothetical protein BS17DRAFT_716196 [Gyrodon lividus]